jgi:Transposase DDE domain
MNIQEYSVATLVAFEKNKNSSAIAREIGESQSNASRFLKQLNFDAVDLVPAINAIFGSRKLTAVIDDTTISKRYAQEIEGTSSMVDHATKTFTNGYKIVAAGLTDGTFFAPIDLEQWVAEFILRGAYLKKTSLVEKIVLRLLELKINIDKFVLDGLYFSKDMMDFFDSKKLDFVIKAKTTTSVIYNGEKMQLKDCPDLRLNSNQSQKKIVAEWNGKKYYFIAVKRTGKRGEKTIYLVANFKTKSRIYARIYKSRWTIEKCFRTCKQFLGLNSSLSQYANIYLNHIKCVFFAYTITQFIMKKFRLDSAEAAIKKAQSLKTKHDFSHIVQQISLLVNYA